MRTTVCLAIGLLSVSSGWASGGEDPLEDSDDPILTAPPPADFCASTLSEMATADAAVSQPFPGLLVSSSSSECDAYVAEALRWAPCNGLLMRVKDTPDTPPGAPPSFCHAPFALLPSEFPASELQRATDLAPIFGRLVDAVAADLPWLEQTLRDTAASDDFTRRLLRLCSKAAAEGPVQLACLGVLRSDYMLHAPESGSGGGGGGVSGGGCVPGGQQAGGAAAEAGGGEEGEAEGKAPRLLQVELNTIASSFAGLSSSVSSLHRHLALRWPALRSSLWDRRTQPKRLVISDALPPNPAVTVIAEALARAHREYGSAEAAVLFVVQPGERNVVDQALLSQALFDAHGVQVLYRTLTQVEQFSRLEGPKRRLTIDGVEVSVVYFRAGYGPDDYPSNREWAARLAIERSLAIKCPTVAYQLAGAKKVQQVLASPSQLDRFLSPKEADAARQVFAGLWSLSGDDKPGPNAPPDEVEAARAMAAAMADPTGFVMKPQREGGGNNLFGEALTAALRQLTRAQRSAYILMQRIEPQAASNLLIRSGEIYRGQTISELGVYSTFLKASNGRVLINRPAGFLVRTKLRGVDEGGVASGFAVLSSPLATLPMKV